MHHDRAYASFGAHPSSTLQLPPAALVSALASHFTLHILIPSTHTFTPPETYLTEASPFQPSRLLFHSTPDGLTHIARSLGGWLVLVSDEVAAEDGEEVERASGKQARVEVEWERSAREVGTFVKGVIRVVAQGGEEVKEGLKHVTVVDGWEGLKLVLGL